MFGGSVGFEPIFFRSTFISYDLTYLSFLDILDYPPSITITELPIKRRVSTIEIPVYVKVIEIDSRQWPENSFFVDTLIAWKRVPVTIRLDRL